MKLIAYSIGIVLLSHFTAIGQDSDVLRIKGGVDIAQATPFSEKYRFDAFREGKVVYTTGKSQDARLNYNRLLGEMQFLDSRGDTFALANEFAIKHISIGESLFYYDHQNGYLETIADFGTIKLAIKNILLIISSDKVGAYGQSTGASSIRSYNTYAASNSRMYKLESKADVLLSKEISYFIVDQNTRFHKAIKTSVFKVFPEHKKAVHQFIKAEAINFRKEEDLKKLLRFCSKLP